MKTLTVTISDEAAAELAAQAAIGRESVEQLASGVVEDAFSADWFDALSEADKAAVREGVAEADRGDFATDAEVEEVFNRFKR